VSLRHPGRRKSSRPIEVRRARFLCNFGPYKRVYADADTVDRGAQQSEVPSGAGNLIATEARPLV
jgi:hypothetical protein